VTILLGAFNAHAQETVTLNLKDADINTLISTVADFSGKNFVVDPRVKGKVTVISAHPMNKDEIYEIFLSIMEVHGFAAIPSGEVTKIVPDIKAKTGSIPTLNQGERSQNDQMVTQVIQVENVNAAQLVPILRPLIPQQGHLAAYPATNVLIISDRAANVNRMVRIIDRIDKVSENEIEVIPLQHASANEIIRILNNLNQAKAANKPSQDAFKLAADDRTNSILLSGERATRLRLRTLISHLDTPLETGGNTRVIYLRYVKAKELATILSGMSGSLQPTQKKGTPIKTSQNSEVNIQADENTNALIITAPPDMFQSLQEVIRKLDIRRAQVLVETIIAEVAFDKARELGVQWIVDGSARGNSPVGIVNFNGSSGIGALASAYKDNTIPAVTDGAQLALGKYSATGSGVNFAALISAMANDASTNILSTPSILTLDNQEAEIVIGQNVPFITGEYSNTGSTTTSVNPFRTIERQDVGITLKVTPQINEGNAVRLEINQESSSLSTTATAGASDLVTKKRVINTTVMVEDGQMIVLGGLIDDTLRQTSQKVPLLGDIPILGKLFRYDKTTKEKKNLLLFLRPVILRDAATEINLTGGKYNYIRTKQLLMRENGTPLFSASDIPVLPEIETPPTPVNTIMEGTADKLSTQEESVEITPETTDNNDFEFPH
jgi:general secretion pathway protein D